MFVDCWLVLETDDWLISVVDGVLIVVASSVLPTLVCSCVVCFPAVTKCVVSWELIIVVGWTVVFPTVVSWIVVTALDPSPGILLVTPVVRTITLSVVDISSLRDLGVTIDVWEVPVLENEC